MMEKHTITYNDKVYEIGEPSIDVWVKLDFWKDILEQDKFVLKIISESTGLSDEEILEADWFDIMQVAAGLTDMLMNTNDKFYNEFEFAGKKYRFIDLPNLTFGEFIDIDSFLQKPEIEKKKQLNFMMALLYREVKEDGTLEKNEAKKLQERSELFKSLPIKYVHGAMGFFLRLEQTLQKPSLKYLMVLKWNKMKRNLNKAKKRVLRSIGVGSVS